MWEHHPSHFWLVLGTAAVSVALAYLTNEAANRRADARLSLISLAFLLSAGFLRLHALATPGALLAGAERGFVVATPVGLFLAACLAAASISPIAGPRAGWLLRKRDAIRNAAIALMVAWGVVSLLRLPPLRGALPAEEAVGTDHGAGRRCSRRCSRSRPGATSRSLVAGAARSRWRCGGALLLAEAMIAVALSRSWHLSWWEWHLLMTARSR